MSRQHQVLEYARQGVWHLITGRRHDVSPRVSSSRRNPGENGGTGFSIRLMVSGRTVTF